MRGPPQRVARSHMNALREKARATASAVAAKASAASEVAMEKAKTEAVRTRPSRPSRARLPPSRTSVSSQVCLPLHRAT